VTVLLRPDAMHLDEGALAGWKASSVRLHSVAALINDCEVNQIALVFDYRPQLAT